jgi:uncharacterized protein YciI
MPYFVLTYDVVENFVERRMPFRPDHLAQVQDAHARGELIMAGALADPVSAMLIFRTEDKAAVEAFAQQDPYVLQGLVKEWSVRPWNVVVGNK